jgi:hypothetical protein
VRELHLCHGATDIQTFETGVSEWGVNRSHKCSRI